MSRRPGIKLDGDETDVSPRRRPKLHLELPANDRQSGEDYRAAYSGVFDATVSERFHGSIEKIDLGGPILSRSTVAGQQTFRRTPIIFAGANTIICSSYSTKAGLGAAITMADRRRDRPAAYD